MSSAGIDGQLALVAIYGTRDDGKEIRRKYEGLLPLMDERMWRCCAGTEADVLGAKGIALVERTTRMSRTTIRAGRDELRTGVEKIDVVETRRPGGGRQRLEAADPTLLVELKSLAEPVTPGAPESPLRWTSKSTRKLAAKLTERGKPVSPQKVGRMLFALGYRLQAPRKTLEASDHPDRNAQFEFINSQVEGYQARSAPAISFDTKKKELVAKYRNGGGEWQPTGEPVPVRIHDFIDPIVGKAIPYGVYDLSRNEGWVNVGVNHDANEFAVVASIARWWSQTEPKVYPNANELLITADA